MGLMTFVVFFVAVLLGIVALRFLIGFVQKAASVAMFVVAGILLVSIITGQPLFDTPTAAVVGDTVDDTVDTVVDIGNTTVNTITNITDKVESFVSDTTP